jgi:tRNA nucleotidyltransferase (CCA-adding enzyme)
LYTVPRWGAERAKTWISRGHGIGFNDLIDAVGSYDPEVVGQWGVVRMDVSDVEVELALPRREYKVGPGHSRFDVDLVPDLSMEEATARRGFRHGVLMCHWKTGRIVALHDGVFHLARGEMRHTSDRFAEDPQQVLRGVEQAARFGFDSVAPDTVALCREMAPRHAELSVSKIWMEWEMLTARGQWPSQGLRFLRKVEWDQHYPGLPELSGADWDATLEAVDRAAEIAEREGLQAGNERGARRRQALVLAAMIHRMPAESGDESEATRHDFLQSINAPGRVNCETLDLTEGLDSWQIRIAGKDGRSVDVRANWLALHLGDIDIPDGRCWPRQWVRIHCRPWRRGVG